MKLLISLFTAKWVHSQIQSFGPFSYFTNLKLIKFHIRPERPVSSHCYIMQKSINKSTSSCHYPVSCFHVIKSCCLGNIPQCHCGLNFLPLLLCRISNHSWCKISHVFSWGDFFICFSKKNNPYSPFFFFLIRNWLLVCFVLWRISFPGAFHAVLQLITQIRGCRQLERRHKCIMALWARPVTGDKNTSEPKLALFHMQYPLTHEDWLFCSAQSSVSSHFYASFSGPWHGLGKQIA